MTCVLIGDQSSMTELQEGVKTRETYHCDVCDYSAHDRRNLQRHKESKHLGKQ